MKMMRSRRAWPLIVVCVWLAWSLMACGAREEAPRKVEAPPQTPVEPSAGEGEGADSAPEAPSEGDKKAVESFEGAITLKEPLSEVDVNEAIKLKDNMRRALFPWSERMEPANARRFLHLAAQDDNPEVIARVDSIDDNRVACFDDVAEDGVVDQAALDDVGQVRNVRHDQ